MLTLGVFTLLYLGLLVFSIVVGWKMLTKCGESGWKCLIPVYGQYVRTCCATNDRRIRLGVLISSIAAIVFSIGGMAFGMSSLLSAVSFGSSNYNSAMSSVMTGGIMSDLMTALCVLSTVVLVILTCISEYMLGLTFDEDKSLGILMASPGLGLFTSAFVVFDPEIEYGGALGEAYESSFGSDDDDEEYDDDEYELEEE